MHYLRKLICSNPQYHLKILTCIFVDGNCSRKCIFYQTSENWKAVCQILHHHKAKTNTADLRKGYKKKQHKNDVILQIQTEISGLEVAERLLQPTSIGPME